MEEKKISRNIIFSVVAVLLLVVVVAGATYAYFASSSSTAKQEITTGSLAMGFESGEFLRADSLMPISDSEIKTKAAELDFSVTNQGTEHMNLTISLTDIIISDDLKDVDFRWGLYNKDKDLGIAFGIFEDIGTQTSVTLLTDTIIDAVLDENEEDITKNYTLRVWIHDDGANQNYMQGETFSAKVTVDGEPITYTPEECFDFNNGAINDYLTSNASCPTDVVIPKTINGVTVTSIDWLYNCDGGSCPNDIYLNSIIIPDTVTNIGSGAIVESGINSITFPESVTTIGIGSIMGNNVKIRNIPESVTYIDESAFDSSEDTIVIPGTITTVYSGYSNQKNIILMEGITSVNSYALAYNSNLTSIEIPSSVTNIGSNAFDSNSELTEIVVRGKTSAPATFDENWNCKNDECSERYNVVFRP